MNASVPETIFFGSSCARFKKTLEEILKRECHALEVKTFPDGEKEFLVNNPLERDHVVFIQETSAPFEEKILEIFFSLQVLRRSGAKTITLILPYFGYGRSQSRVQNNTGDFLLHLFWSAGATRVFILDPHQPFSGHSSLDIYPISLVSLWKEVLKHQMNSASHTDLVVFGLDRGSEHRGRALGEALGVPWYVLEKKRGADGIHFTLEKSHIPLEGKTGILVDDILDTGETLGKAVWFLKGQGMEVLYALVTHGVFSDGCVSRIASYPLKTVFISDSISKSTDIEANFHPKISRVSVIPFILQSLEKDDILSVS